MDLGPTFQLANATMFFPEVFLSEEEGYNYLSSLDSDTRAYVLSHSNEFRTKDDIIKCVNELHRVK